MEILDIEDGVLVSALLTAFWLLWHLANCILFAKPAQSPHETLDILAFQATNMASQ